MAKNDNKTTNELSSQAMRPTRQRALIMEVLNGTTQHPTADWIYDKVRKKCPNVSLGTIYRNLNLLKFLSLV